MVNGNHCSKKSWLLTWLAAGLIAAGTYRSAEAQPLYGVGLRNPTNLLIFDPVTNTLVHTTPNLFVLNGGGDQAASPDGEALFLSDAQMDVLVKHNIPKEKRRGTRKVPFARWFDLTADGRRLFILAVPSENAVFVMNTRPLRKLAEVGFEASAYDVRILPDGSKAFVMVKFPSPDSQPNVMVVSGNSFTVTNTVELVADPAAFIRSTTLSVDASRLYLGLSSATLGRVLVVFDTEAEVVQNVVDLGACFPRGLAATSNRIWVDCEHVKLLALNATTWEVDGELLFDRQFTTVFVASDALNKVFVGLAGPSPALGVINATDITLDEEVPIPEAVKLRLGPKTALRKARITPTPGRLKVKTLRFDPSVDSAIDPPSQTVSVTVSDSDGPAWAATVPLGNFQVDSRGRFRFTDSSGTLANGLQRMLISPPTSPASLYFSADMRARSADLAAIDKPDVTLTLTIGSETFTVSRPFIEKAGRFRFP